MTTIKLKNGSGAPTAGDLVQGEPALDLTNKRLYTEDSGGTVIEVGTNPGEDVTFADNRKAVFGAGSDLQIYHSGTGSYIEENGTGNLFIEATNLRIKSASGENYIAADQDGAVTLYNDNSAKLATTSTGIDVTGVITTDGMTTSADINFGDNDKAVFGAGNDLSVYHDGSNSYIKEEGTGNLEIGTNGGNITLKNLANSETLALFNINSGVNLYYDNAVKLETTSTGIDVTGNTDSDTVTIGTSSIGSSTKLQVAGRGLFTDGLPDPADGSPAGVAIGYNTTSGYGFIQAIQTGVANKDLYVQPNGANNVIIANSGGNVGIGTSSPAYKLQANGSGTIARFTDGTSHMDFYAGSNLNEIATASPLLLSVGGTERMRIDSSGLVAIGTSSPVSTAQLTIGGTSRIAPVSGNGLLLASGGSDRMFISTAGNVGIGTSSPSNLLTISDATTAKLELNRNGTIGNGWIVSTDNAANEEVAIQMYNSEFRLYNNSTQNFTVTSGGNVGIGTSSPSVALEVDGTIKASGNGKLQIADDTEGSTFEFNVGGDGALEIYDGATERMRIDSSGNVGIGTDSPNDKVDISGSTGDGYRLTDGTHTGVYRSISGGTILKTTSNHALLFGTNDTEAMRIDSSGNLLVGTTTQSGRVTIDNDGSTTGLNVFQTSTATNYVPLNIHNDRVTGGNTAVMIRFQAGDNTDVGSIDSTVTATAYNTSSDQRLKDNIVDAPSASDDIDAIQVRSFDWKADGSHQKYGMVAQELQSVAPEAVSGDADSEDMMGVDYSKLVPMMMKEIQSLRARVAQLEGAN